MELNKIILLVVIMIFNNFCFGQEEVKRNRKLDLINDPLTPSKAAFYSAVMPGLGQIYTGNAWKVPLVYAAIGTAVYSYSYNNKEMNKYRDAYKRRISGYLDDEYIDLIPQDEKLLVGMDFHKKYRDMSFIFIIGTYMLNILEANVSAHLMQFNVSDELSFKPNIDFEPITESANIGVKIKINL